MKESEKEIRNAISDNLGDLFESIINREKPFDQVPFHPEVSHIYLNYYKYEKELEGSLKSQILEALVAWARFSIKDKLIGFPFSYEKKFPKHYDIENYFLGFIKENEQNGIASRSYDSFTILPAPVNKSLVKKIVKQTVRQRMPEYKIDNKAFGPIGFSKPWNDKNKIYIHVDTGSWRYSLNFSIGLGYPKYCIDIAEFFGHTQSHYSERYLSVEHIRDGTNKALDFIEFIMPHFEVTNKTAFEMI
jgi:hypothetical protein